MKIEHLPDGGMAVVVELSDCSIRTREEELAELGHEIFIAWYGSAAFTNENKQFEFCVEGRWCATFGEAESVLERAKGSLKQDQAFAQALASGWELDEDD